MFFNRMLCYLGILGLLAVSLASVLIILWLLLDIFLWRRSLGVKFLQCVVISVIIFFMFILDDLSGSIYDYYKTLSTVLI